MSNLFKQVITEFKQLNEAPVEIEPETPSTPEGEAAVDHSDGEIIHQGDFYVLKSTPEETYIIVRLADGAMAKFEVDDTPEIDTDINKMLDFDENDFISAFDEWAANFDIVMELPDKTESIDDID